MRMKEQEAFEFVKKNAIDKLLAKDKNGTGFICPTCHSGLGKHGTGMVSKDGIHYKCFGCGMSADVFDIYCLVTGMPLNTNFRRKKESLYNMLGIIVDGEISDCKCNDEKCNEKKEEIKMNDNLIKKTSEEVTKVEQTKSENNEDKKEKCESFIKQCKEALAKCDKAQLYLLNRGINLATMRSADLGYDKAHDAIVIPYPNSSYYISRRIETTPGQNSYFFPPTEVAGKKTLFRDFALYDDSKKYLFIVESQICALSILQENTDKKVDVVALGGVGEVNKLLDILKSKKINKQLVLALDSDEVGKRTQEKLKEELKKIDIDFVESSICNQFYKDPNSALVSDKETFKNDIKNDVERLRTVAESKIYKDNVSSYIANSFLTEIEEVKKQKIKMTKFKTLDENLGGLRPGLYTVGAISSLGKTTLMHSIADNLASDNETVLYFSLEQTRFELVSKSLTRQAFLDDEYTSCTSAAIRDGKYNVTSEMLSKYTNKVGNKLSIIDGCFNLSIEEIVLYCTRFVKDTETRPIIIIDYLQAIKTEFKGSVKEQVDHIVQQLKILSNKLKCTIFVISSFNRSNYMSPVDFESFKESGGIEYTSDVVLGLQLSCLNEELFTKDSKIVEKRQRIKEEKEAKIRKVELVCLKNRYGVSSFTVPFLYYPSRDTFKVIEEESAIDDIMMNSEHRTF